MILQGDCLERLRELPDNSIDSIVSDPPYGLSFMGKKWDYSVPSKEIWAEALRVLKPGGHLLAFGGTRTYHRLVVNIEDAGFEIRDQVMWIYGSGFPKSMDISKQIDKQAGAKREVIGLGNKGPNIRGNNFAQVQGKEAEQFVITAPSTDLAKQWQGWGTALKPANEPICVARKPISEKTVAQNVIRWGVGGLNIDESRVDLQPGETTHGSGRSQSNNPNTAYGDMGEKRVGVPNIKSTQGRWPANIIFDEEAAEELDLQVGHLAGAGNKSAKKAQGKTDKSIFGAGGDGTPSTLYDRGGSASRFFYVAKASKRERNQGLEGMPKKAGGSNAKGYTADVAKGVDRNRPTENFHPTVKPVKLMEYLIKLVTPPGGTVLDPFAGSGTTGVAAKRLGFKFIGCELNPEYVGIAEKRIEATA